MTYINEALETIFNEYRTEITAFRSYDFYSLVKSLYFKQNGDFTINTMGYNNKVYRFVNGAEWTENTIVKNEQWCCEWYAVGFGTYYTYC